MIESAKVISAGKLEVARIDYEAMPNGSPCIAASDANARLIAAAPDLLAALQKIADRDTSRPATFTTGMSPHLAAALAWDMDAEIARAAIAKATK